MKQKLCAILILIMLLLNSSLMTVISVAVDAVSDVTDSTNEEVEENAKVSNVDLKLNADYLVNNVENKVELTATLKTDDTKYSLFKNPTISIEMPSEIVDVVIETPYLMYNNQIFTITKSEVITNDVGNKVINIQLQGEQTEYETDSILEGTNIVIPASIVVSKQIDTMVSNMKLRYTNEIESQTIYEANGEDCEQQEIKLINKIVRNLPAIASDEEAKTIEFEQDGIKVEIIEKVGNTVIPDNGTLYEQQIVKNVVRFTNNSTTAKPVNFTANIPDGLTYIEFVPQEIVHNEEYDAYYIPRHPYYIYDESKKQININIEQLGIGETQETYFEFRVEDLGELTEKIISIDYELINNNGEVGKYSISNTINQAEITAFLDCYRLNDITDWQYALTVTNITDRTLNNINIFCEIDKNFNIDEIYKYIGSGEHENYDLSNVQDNTFTYSISSIEPGEEYYIAVNGRSKDKYEDNDANTYEMKGVYTVYGDEINRYVSNETSVTAGIEKVKVSMTSDKDGQELKTDDEITYTINIQNIGNEKLAMSKYSNIRVSDFIPKELEPISATYNNFVIDTQYVSEIADYVGAPLKVERYTEEQKTVDLTYRVIPEGSTEDDVPNLDLNLSIPYGETITIVIKAKVKMVVEKFNITNSATVEGKDMSTKTASVTNTLLPYNYGEELFPEQPEQPDSGDIGGGTIVDPENPEQPSTPEEDTKVNVTGVELIPTETRLKVGQSTELVANVVPNNATNKAISWGSSDESVAVVVNGTVMAIKEGTAVITVVTEDGNKTATSTVIVEGNNGDDSTISVTGIQITPNSSTILVGGTVKLRSAVIPSNATNSKVTWSSSNQEVATVSNNGLVTGIKEGRATITVTTEDGNKTATCEIIVQNVNDDSSKPIDPENPEQPTEPENPADPEQPTTPEEPTNPENPEQPEEEKMTVSGTAWIDTNENGKRENDEPTVNGMTVMLYNYQTKKLVSTNGIAIEKKTDESGRYEFTDLEKGKYIVIFWYDTANYELTEYQKAGISNSENSDAVSKNVKLKGEKKIAGLTDILTIEQNAENIDIGLVENKEFDFSIQKYISKITIQTNKETKTYTYDNKNFAKVEVHSKQINGAQAIIEYKMVVKNEGELPGKVDLIVDEVPSDLNFYSELNSSWYKSKDGICTTALSGETIGVGETREVTIVLTKNLSGNNVGTVSNNAKIAQTSNEKAIEEENVENNTAKAEVLITVSTGLIKWIGLVIGTLIVLGIMAFIAIKDKKLMKTISFMFIVGILIFGNATQVFAIEFISKEAADREWSSTGYKYEVQVGNEVLWLQCVEPKATMCGTGPSYHKGTFSYKKEIEGTRKTSSTGDTNIPDNVDFTLQNETVQTNVSATVSGNTVKMGPFKINAVRDGVSATDVNVTTCNVTYSIIQADGSVLNNQVLAVNNIVLGEEFYIDLPINTIRVDKINVSAECSYQAEITFRATYRYYYTITATGSAGNHHKSCLTSNLQTLARDVEDGGGYKETAHAEKELEIRGPWSVPGNLLIEKISYDSENEPKTYLKNVGIKITKGTNTSDSKYLGLYNSNGVRATSVKVGENLEFSNYSADESTINPTVKINGVSYTAKWDATKENATKLILTQGKVLVKNLRVSERYTVIEVNNPNYGYDTIVNKDITKSIQITQPPNSQNVLTIKNGKGTGSLVIKKVDEDNNSIGLSGVEVVVKAKKNNQEMGYIKIIADESVSNVSKFGDTHYAEFVTGYAKIKDMEITDTAPIMYVDTPEEATKFITGADGTVTIANLPATFVGANSTANEKSEKWYYKVEEHANPNYGYAKEKYSEFGNVTYLADSTGTWAVDTNTGWKLLPTVYLSDSNDPKHTYGSSYKVTMTNKKLTGNIHIDKYDVEAGSDEKLGHIGFVLKADLIETTENSNSGMFNISGKYIKVKISHGTHSDDAEGFANYTEGKVRIADGGFVGSANSVIKFVDKPEEATIFYTNQDGEILIANILESTNGSNYIKYKIEEYDSKTYGYVDGESIKFSEYKVSTDSALPRSGYTIPYLPDGYSCIEDDLDEGIVIQDSAGNEYVWVEVPKTSDVYQTAGLNITQFTDEEYKKIENDLHTYTSDYRRDGLVDEHFGNDNLTGMTQLHYNNQKKQMLKSIYQYGGFYVGRYETGIEDTWRTENAENIETTAPTETPVIKANAYPYNTVTPAEAQSLAMSFATVGHISSLMYGVQWDLMLKYIEQNGTEQELLTQESYSWGNYYISSYTIDNVNAKYFDETGEKTWKNGAYGNKDTRNMVKLSTGASNIFAKQNIYDIAGNVSELTLENKPIYGDDNKITSSAVAIRGGNYQCENEGINIYANTYYVKTDEKNRDSTVGFRVALYKTEDINKEANIERVTEDGWVTPKRQKSTATRTNAVNESVSVDVEVGNYKQTGNLEINKVDNDETDIKLQSVEFVLQAKIEQEGETEPKYVKAIVDANNVTIGQGGYAERVIGDCRIRDLTNSIKGITAIGTEESVSLKLVDTIEDATRFVTNSQGQIRILNLLVTTNGTDKILYRPIEVENNNYGYLANENTIEYETVDGWIQIERQEYKDTTWEVFNENSNSDTDSNTSQDEETTIEVTSPYLPTGFRYIDEDNGIVIEDRLGNQYVWVEVPKTSEVYPTAGLKVTSFTEEEFNRIEKDLQQYTSTYRNETSNVDEYSGSKDSTGLTSDEYYLQKKKMLKSIYVNGGFYVGRYETGIANSYRTEGGTTLQTAVIKANAYPYTNVTCSQAQTIAKGMASGEYTSSLMFGVQWDLVLKYLETQGATESELNEDSTKWGNYINRAYNLTETNAKYSEDHGNTWIDGAYGMRRGDTDKHLQLSTGTSKGYFSKQNIFDLAGNVCEWTLEYTSDTNNPCTVRGGRYNFTGEQEPASWRYNSYSSFYSPGFGFRVSLYKDEGIGGDTTTEQTLPYLPEGYSYVEGDYSTGIVIEDRFENQYVWVEVPQTSEVYPTAGLNIIKFTDEEFKMIENDLHTYTAVYRNGTSNVDEHSGNDNSTGLTNEQYYELKKKMLKSIYQNGGFYVGRYETGIADSYRTSTGEATETPVIQEFAYPYTYVTNSQAQSLASTFAKNGYSGGYSTGLMFGVQWDLVLKYLETKGSTEYELNKNSSGWGNYFDSSYAIPNAMAKYSTNLGQTWLITSSYLQKDSGAHMLLSTGVSKKWFSKQNIYELAGNVGEWTLEYNTNNSKNPSVVRGSNMSPSGISQASWRDSFSDTTNNAYTGFRVALYKTKETGTKFTITTIKNKKQTMNLQINKVDIDSNETLKRARFAIKADLNDGTINNKYIKIIPEGAKDYPLEAVTGTVRVADKVYTSYDNLPCVDFVDNIEDATQFETDDNGQITIMNLLMSTNGSNRIQYTPVEVQNDHYGYVVNGNNATVRLDGYALNENNIAVRIKEQTRESGYTEAKFTFNRQTSTDTFSDTAVIKDENIITVKNIKQTGNLYINKGDYDQFDKVKLEEVTFLVKAHYKDENGNENSKYIKIMADDTIEGYEENVQNNDKGYADVVKGQARVKDQIYNKETEQDKSPLLFVDDEDNATKFVTNAEGKIIIMNLLMSSNGTDNIEYSFEEIGNRNYGYVASNETLRHKDQSLETVQDVKYKIPVQLSTETSANASQENKEKYPINLRNIKQTGNLQIDKVDFDDGSKLSEEVTFAVKVRSNKNPTINGKYIRIIVDEVYQANVEGYDDDGYAKVVKGVARVKDKCYKETPFKTSVDYVENYENATKFVTDSNGQIFIMNLMMSVTGSDKIEYMFEELVNNNYGYVAEAGQYNNYTLRYPNQDINTIEAVPQEVKRQSSLETLNQPNLATQVTLRNIKQTGNLAIEKVDKDNPDEKLANVEFVLKAQRDQDITHESNKYYDKVDGRYVKAETETLTNGGIRIVGIDFVDDIEEATKFKTDEKGSIKLYNLLMSTNGADKIMYQLIETKNPNYGYLANSTSFADFKVTYKGDRLDGDYVMIERQTKTETDGTESENDTHLTVENDPTYTRLSGMVWEDINKGKTNNIDNLYNENADDALIEGVAVYLYKDGEVVAKTYTDKNGYYVFGTYSEDGSYEDSDYWGDTAPGRDGDTLISNAENENGNIVISDLDKYHIEFEYDGLRFTTVAQLDKEYDGNGAETTRDTEPINSKGKEEAKGRADYKDRESVDESFRTISGGTNDGSIITGISNGHDLKYNANTPQNNQSQYIDHWGYSEYETNDNGNKYFTLTPPENGEDYAIRSSVKGTDITWKPEYAETDMIPYINQGLYRREQPDLAIESDIEKVEVIVDEYTNTYKYSGRGLENEDFGEETDGFGVEVKYGNKVGTSYSSRGLDIYTRPLYASDLAYNLTDPDRELMQVYVTYQIVVKNQSNTLTTKVNEIVNYFDSRYEIESINGATYDANAIEDVSEESQAVKYKKVKLTLPEELIEHNQKSSTITIRFKLNKDALIAIAHERATLYNVSEITSYSTFYGDGTLCAENKTANENGVKNKIYAGIDTDSAPGSANVVAEIEPAENGNNITKIKINGDEVEYDYSTPNVKLSDSSKATFEDDTGLAPSLILGIDEKDPTRGLNGIVFEDNATFEDCDNEEHTQTGIHPGETRVGNGTYEEGENLIKDAKVELYNVNETQGDSEEGNATTRAKLYKLIIEGNMAHVEVEDAVTWSKDAISDNSGKTYNYEIMGVIPDEYLIRYSYGNLEETAEDGTTTSKVTQIVQPDGKLKEVAAMDYKSTVLKSDTIIQALDIFNTPDRIKNLNWMLVEEKNGENIIRYSDAADDLNLRNDQEDIYYSKNYELDTMTADTAVFEVGVEFEEVADKVNDAGEIIGKATETKELVLEDVNGDGKFGIGDKVVKAPRYSIVNPYQDFGIIERAIPDQYIEKTVSNLKIVLQNGQELINGNPYEDDLSYVKALKMGDNPREDNQKRIYVEIDNEILQGATLYLTYDITAYNNSELDYKYNKKDASDPNAPDVPDTPGNRFYYFGEKGGGVEVQNSILKVVDYMDNELVLDKETITREGKWDIIDTKYLTGTNPEGKLFISDEVKESLGNNNYTILMTDEFEQLQPGEQATIQTYASKLLSVGDGNLSFVNHVEIIHTTGTRKVNNSTPGNYEPSQQNPNEQDDDNVRVVITPPTGLPLSKVNQ